jgi:hypothetical protein
MRDAPPAAEGAAGIMSIYVKDSKTGENIAAPAFDSVTSLDIQALIDNELDPERKDFVRAVIQHHPSLERKFEELCRQKELLRLWWKHSAQNI